ncbi:MAG TPA: hypothetical protein VK501_09730 [Baekduia sp.]|uniref:hypothetical protein n=1 Tax=Baekduia sp. TaxID=2600305 RepID=UPI002B6D61B1|nr:hypothetical protein [Baekduia sp.]HMJ34188.1 hypothetical protein [Baekduia sp.]
MPDEIDRGVEPNQSADFEPIGDVLLCQAKRTQLAVGNRAMLPCGELADLEVRVAS